MPLTDVAIRRIKPSQHPQKISDSEGLHLFVAASGAKLWRMSYRYMGKQKLLSFGAYPAVSLADARRARDAAKQVLAAGEDPGLKVKLTKIAKRAGGDETFGKIAEEYKAKLIREGRAAPTVEKVSWLLGLATPSLGRRPIREITAPEILETLRRVEVRGRYESARRLRSTIGSVFRYAVATARADNDPTFALRGALTAPQTKSWAALTDPKAFGALLRAIDGFEGQATTTAALKLLALLFPRPGELRAAHWSEFNLDEGVWIVPEARMKMRRPHRVPLSKQAVAILKDVQQLTGHGTFVFPSIRSVLRPMSENTLNAALRRLGFTKEEMTSHGFRASASSMLNESGYWHPDAIERQLAHVEENSVRRAYARGEHWDERVRMMAWWADRLDELRAGGS
ncbi:MULTISPECIES: integrase arm-type DNA-binding domain-containing protein [unclassified Chelatococcus]|uniref:tyrosine-type recombinase/integrase n=1 Tax=unclassified Chelatococcus TaxID=2638111 RepID=UPI001BCA7E08|nr:MULTISPECIES: integrase arm-type DNA-binding domain-containing protein [unclassified Chelatococcus]CAH1655071.1 putative protein IntB [Hyphomicrobiales bacterium]MBS7740327.1 tyrosine-type recombinase/integrase [Chelatococcus sp. HY11]MBX3547152.1 tyrosine-type recombinase/integrase [Chelatococcus sp.]MCO5078430.1 tyrosine-type recombinase/integrase [Chelatococcus sp.]CAH1685204.1 putative protein IntB [Hyphomicrobiales bacterium]